ncbi:MAG: hypothetical protein R2838_17390 [Caldilineaceae bacterium]
MTITVEVGPDVTVDRVTPTSPSTAANRRASAAWPTARLAIPLALVETRWEPLLWDYVEVWRAGSRATRRHAGPVSHSGLVDGGPAGRSLEPRAEHRPHGGTAGRYGYTVDTFAPPAWAREAVIYHVFVDRFTGVENRWLELPRWSSSRAARWPASRRSWTTSPTWA